MGLLNIGVEEIKGIEEVRQAHAWLKETDLPIDYRGFVEGDQIGQGVVDVVVVEGFRRQHRAQDRRGHRQADGRVRCARR